MNVIVINDDAIFEIIIIVLCLIIFASNIMNIYETICNMIGIRKKCIMEKNKKEEKKNE